MKPRGMMVIHNFRPGPVGGAELQAERLATQLANLGHPMQVLTSLTVPDAPAEELLGGVLVHRVPHRLAYWVRNDAANTFRFLVRQRRTYDVLHAHMAYGHAVVAMVVAKSFRKKCIVKIACAGEFGELHAFSNFEGFSDGLRILHQADAIIAVSSEVERELLQYGFRGERILRIPNGVDTRYFMRTAPFPDRNKVRFILTGRRHPQKGVDILLQAARRLKERKFGGRFEIRLCGEDYPEHDYQDMARTLNVSDVVTLAPFEKDILSVYLSAHCFLLPSRGEGLSNALLEAMAMELPVIATPVSGTVDVVEDGKDGILIPVGSSDALAEAMERIITEPDVASELGKHARQKVARKFSLQSTSRQYSELYQRLCH